MQSVKYADSNYIDFRVESKECVGDACDGTVDGQTDDVMLTCDTPRLKSNCPDANPIVVLVVVFVHNFNKTSPLESNTLSCDRAKWFVFDHTSNILLKLSVGNVLLLDVKLCGHRRVE